MEAADVICYKYKKKKANWPDAEHESSGGRPEQEKLSSFVQVRASDTSK